VEGPDGLRIPVRRVDLTNGEHFDLYDTSGPYTDDAATIDVRKGLPKLRQPWIDAREPVDGAATQLAWARAGIVTPGDAVHRRPRGSWTWSWCAARSRAAGR